MNLLFLVLQEGAGSHENSTTETKRTHGALSHHSTWTRAVHTNKEAELCLIVFLGLLPKKQHIEIDLLPTRSGLKNECHQAEDNTLLQEHCNSAKGLREDSSLTLEIAVATQQRLLLWSAPSHLPGIYHSPLAHWKSKEVWKRHSGLRG